MMAARNGSCRISLRNSPERLFSSPELVSRGCHRSSRFQSITPALIIAPELRGLNGRILPLDSFRLLTFDTEMAWGQASNRFDSLRAAVVCLKIFSGRNARLTCRFCPREPERRYLADQLFP